MKILRLKRDPNWKSLLIQNLLTDPSGAIVCEDFDVARMHVRLADDPALYCETVSADVVIVMSRQSRGAWEANKTASLDWLDRITQVPALN